MLIMRQELRRFVPTPQPEIADIFAAYQATSHFYNEVHSREAIKRYCDWYYTTAQHHRQELQQMQGEINILGWFRRGEH